MKLIHKKTNQIWDYRYLILWHSIFELLQSGEWEIVIEGKPDTKD